MSLLDSSCVVCISKEEVIDVMRHVQGGDFAIHLQSSIDVLVCMAAEMKIARDLLHCEIPFHVAA